MNDFGRILGPVNPDIDLFSLPFQPFQLGYTNWPFQITFGMNYFTTFSDDFFLEFLLDMVLAIKISCNFEAFFVNVVLFKLCIECSL